MILHYLMDSLDNFNDRKLVQGTVVNNNDPLKKSRLKIKIKGISDKIKDDHLPWYPMVQSSINSGTKIPPIGSRVVVLYTDIYNSLVLGSIVSITPE